MPASFLDEKVEISGEPCVGCYSMPKVSLLGNDPSRDQIMANLESLSSDRSLRTIWALRPFSNSLVMMSHEPLPSPDARLGLSPPSPIKGLRRFSLFRLDPTPAEWPE